MEELEREQIFLDMLAEAGIASEQPRKTIKLFLQAMELAYRYGKDIPIVEGNYYWVKARKNGVFEPAKAVTSRDGKMQFRFIGRAIVECNHVNDYKEIKSLIL